MAKLVEATNWRAVEGLGYSRGRRSGSYSRGRRSGNREAYAGQRCEGTGCRADSRRMRVVGATATLYHWPHALAGVPLSQGPRARYGHRGVWEVQQNLS